MAVNSKIGQWLFVIVTLIGLGGCASAGGPFIPENLAQLNPERARIVVSRERQLAGKYTPVYIIDIGKHLDDNSEMFVRIGNFIQEPGLHLWYAPAMMNSFSPGGFMVLPGSNITFSESGLRLDDLLTKNLNAVIYVDRLRCNPRAVSTLFCGDGKKDCMAPWKQDLNNKQGVILDRGRSIPSDIKSRRVQVAGPLLGGETLIWDREPGLMRLGALWGSNNQADDTLELTPGNIAVEAGKTYYLHYEISLGDHVGSGDRWKITRVE